MRKLSLSKFLHSVNFSLSLSMCKDLLEVRLLLLLFIEFLITKHCCVDLFLILRMLFNPKRKSMLFIHWKNAVEAISLGSSYGCYQSHDEVTNVNNKNYDESLKNIIHCLNDKTFSNSDECKMFCIEEFNTFRSNEHIRQFLL